jgi:hypothetical protein
VVPAAGSKAAGPPKTTSRPPEAAVKPPVEALPLAPAPRDTSAESDAARKERLRKATGL